MEAYILVLFLKYGYAGGVVAIPYVDKLACEAGLQAASTGAKTLQDGFCIPNITSR